MIPLALGDVSVEINVAPALSAAVRRKYEGFLQAAAHPESPALRLFVCGTPALTPGEPEALPKIGIARLGPALVGIAGDCSGELDLAAMRGQIEGPNALAGLDALLRLGLSLLAPRTGYLLLHGAAVALEDGRWVILLGHSGTGKSTAARAFTSFCDELVLVRSGASGCEAASTPYWGGRPGRADCAAIVCLHKGGEPEIRRVRGADAVRAIAPHALRHVQLERSDENAMAAMCNLARCAPVFEARCPTGFAYVPFLARALAGLGCAPIARQMDGTVPDARYA